MADKYYEQSKRMDSWLASATRFVRFGPDKKAVRGELFNHIMDREASYLARGFSKEEARRYAMDDMGDPNAIAAELGRLHRPFWGYVLRASQVALVILLIIVLFPLSPYNLRLLTGADVFWYIGSTTEHLSAPPEPVSGPQNTQRGSAYLDILEEYDLRGSAETANHEITVPAAWLEQTTYSDGTNTTTGRYELVFYIKASTWQIWATAYPRDDMISQHMLRDSRGTTYSNRTQSQSFDGDLSFTCNAYYGVPGTTWYEVRLDLGTDQTPDWLQVPIGYGNHSLRIDFKEGVVS